MRGCKHHYLVFFICFSQAFNGVWSYINTSINDFSCREYHFKHLIGHLTFQVIHAMNQCLIQVKYYSLFLGLWILWRWKHECFLDDFIFGRPFYLL